MTVIPAWPHATQDNTGDADVVLRFDDVSQDGRVMLTTIPQALTDVLWRGLLGPKPMTAACIAQGVIPILTRMVVEGGEGPVSANAPLSARGAYDLAHTRDAGGAVERILLRMWAEAHAPKGRTYGPQPLDAGARILAGRVFAEHVFTRLFAASKADRRVDKLTLDGLPEVPGDTVPWRAFDEVTAVPDGATTTDWILDPAPTVFGLGQTDSNLHVNSLAYPWLFEAAALRVLHALGRNVGALFPSRFEIAWKKPSFAGEAVRWKLRVADVAGATNVLGTLHADARPDESPRCHVSMTFR